MSDTDQTVIKEELVQILEINIGKITAGMYRSFYADKDLPTVITSVSELLTEFIGPDQKHEVLHSILQKYHVSAGV